jgi:hypothetical protein
VLRCACWRAEPRIQVFAVRFRSPSTSRFAPQRPQSTVAVTLFVVIERSPFEGGISGDRHYLDERWSIGGFGSP